MFDHLFNNIGKKEKKNNNIEMLQINFQTMFIVIRGKMQLVLQEIQHKAYFLIQLNALLAYPDDDYLDTDPD